MYIKQKRTVYAVLFCLHGLCGMGRLAAFLECAAFGLVAALGLRGAAAGHFNLACITIVAVVVDTLVYGAFDFGHVLHLPAAIVSRLHKKNQPKFWLIFCFVYSCLKVPSILPGQECSRCFRFCVPVLQQTWLHPAQ